MLTRGDDYPIHQRPDPIAYAGGNRNFYDRYFFNGYTRDGEHFFALALGVYPVRNIIDAAFSVVTGGVQRSVFASRVLGMERMDVQVGPISIDVIEPLQRLRFRVAPNDWGVLADLTFEGRTRAIEEPRFLRRTGPQVMMDVTRLTQHGAYTGWFDVAGTRVAVEPTRFWGVRDRSWGIRPIGERDAPGAVVTVPQFYWLWAPLNFEDGGVLFGTNEDERGIAWHTNGVWAPLGDAEAERMETCAHRIEFKSGTRHARSAEIVLRRHPALGGQERRIQLEPLYNFYMKGIGYTHPEWGHGTFKGELAVGGDQIELASVDEAALDKLHVQAFCRARMGDREGVGVLEQLIIGMHEPSGFKEFLDMAP